MEDKELLELCKELTAEKMVDELFEKLIGAGSHVRHCDRSVNSCSCALKDEYKKEVINVINRIRLQDKIDLLGKIKSMGVYNADEPDERFVWSWKITRESMELEKQLKEISNE